MKVKKRTIKEKKRKTGWAMNKIYKEFIILSIFIILVLYIGLKTTNWNNESLKKISKILFAVKSSVANVRSAPNTASKIKFKLKKGQLITPIDMKDSWLYIEGIGTEKKGWMHKVTLGRYLYLGYYKEYMIDKSVFELKW